MTHRFKAILGHVFQRPAVLAEALTHRSATQGKGRARASNERLEFIGDRVLGLAMAEWLAERFPREQEGELGRRLASLGSPPVLADAREAALGALYMDGGLDVARDFVRRAWNEAMVLQAEPPKDAKTALQEW